MSQRHAFCFEHVVEPVTTLWAVVGFDSLEAKPEEGFGFQQRLVTPALREAIVDRCIRHARMQVNDGVEIKPLFSVPVEKVNGICLDETSWCIGR